MRRFSSRPRGLALILPLVLCLLLSACSLGGSDTTSTPATSADTPTTAAATDTPTPSGPTPTPSPTPTPTVPPIASCSQVSGFETAGAVAMSPAFPEVGLPAGTVGSVTQTFETNGYLFAVYTLCSNAFKSGHLQVYFATGLPGSGFPQSANFPYHGDPTSACGDTNCWTSSGGAVKRSISLESLTADGLVSNYTLRLAIAPLTGATTIPGGNSFKLDATGGGAGDLVWHLINSTTRQMERSGSATIANVGATSFSGYTLTQLQGISYGTSISGGDVGNLLVNNDVFAVHTNGGHYAKVLVVSTGPTPTFTISIQYVLYLLTF